MPGWRIWTPFTLKFLEIKLPQNIYPCPVNKMLTLCQFPWYGVYKKKNSFRLLITETVNVRTLRSNHWGINQTSITAIIITNTESSRSLFLNEGKDSGINSLYQMVIDSVSIRIITIISLEIKESCILRLLLATHHLKSLSYFILTSPFALNQNKSVKGHYLLK